MSVQIAHNLIPQTSNGLLANPNIQQQFREILDTLSNFNSEDIQYVTMFAQQNYQYSQDIAQILIEKITSSQFQLPYIYIMDSIIKNVQGLYKRHFQERIHYIFMETFKRLKSSSEQKTMIKLLRIWEYFIDREQIMIIRSRIKSINQLEARLLNQEEQRKIEAFARTFQPYALPESVRNSGDYFQGTDFQPRNYEQIPPQNQYPKNNMQGIMDLIGMINGKGGMNNQNPQTTYPTFQPEQIIQTPAVNYQPISMAQLYPFPQSGYQEAPYQQPMIGNNGSMIGNHQPTSHYGQMPFYQPIFETQNNSSQFGFLPSILKSFYNFKHFQLQQIRASNLDYGVGQKSKLPFLENPAAYSKELNANLIQEIYDSIKFQCSICGMRFIRNQTLKMHLDMHFKKNNDSRRRGNRAVSRPFFMTIKDFVVPKSSQQNLRNARGGGAGQGQQNSDEYVQYSSKETQCYICKENLEVVMDDDDECWYFIKAKKIKIQSPSETGKKLIVIVHSECLKQVEMSKGEFVLMKGQFGAGKEANNAGGFQQNSSFMIENKINEEDKDKIQSAVAAPNTNGCESIQQQLIGGGVGGRVFEGGNDHEINGFSGGEMPEIKKKKFAGTKRTIYEDATKISEEIGVALSMSGDGGENQERNREGNAQSDDFQVRSEMIIRGISNFKRIL